MDDLILYREAQRAEARRRHEEYRYAEFHLITSVQTDMARNIWSPDLGMVPSDFVLAAPRAVPSDL